MNNGTMHNNPLVAPILKQIRNFPQGLSEHELIKQLQGDASLASDAIRSDLALFQTHFLVMNALYRLQGSLREEGLLLQIDPLCIRLLPLTTADPDRAVARDQTLRRYYLDLDQLQQTTASDVTALLQGFWDRYYAIDCQAEALRLLGLVDEGTPSWERIQQHYRRQAARHHPDRGGDTARFVEIREAYELLRQLHGNRG